MFFHCSHRVWMPHGQEMVVVIHVLHRRDELARLACVSKKPFQMNTCIEVIVIITCRALSYFIQESRVVTDVTMSCIVDSGGR